MIKRIVILKNNDLLIHKYYEPGKEEAISTLGDFQATVNSIKAKVIAGQKREEILGNNKITYELDPPILFIISSDQNEQGILEVFIPELKNLFFGVFPKDFINTMQGNDLSVFKGFEQKLDQIHSAFENRIMTKPGSRRVLDALSTMELPQRLQKTATTILDAKILSFEQIIELTKVTPQEAVANIQEILNAGFLYTTKMGNSVYYTIKSFGEQILVTSSTTIPPIVTSTITTSAVSREPTTTATAAKRPSGLEVKKRDINKGNMPFLIKQFKKDLDKVFSALLTKKLLLIIIDPNTDKNHVLLNMILDTIQCFVPERELRIVSYTKDFIHPKDADIIRIDKGLAQFYSNEVICDMDNKRITNGENSIYLEDLIKEMSKLKHSECVSLLLNRVKLIEKLSQDWGKIKKLNLPTEDFILNVRTKYNPSIIEIMDKVATNLYMV